MVSLYIELVGLVGLYKWYIFIFYLLQDSYTLYIGLPVPVSNIIIKWPILLVLNC